MFTLSWVGAVNLHSKTLLLSPVGFIVPKTPQIAVLDFLTKIKNNFLAKVIFDVGQKALKSPKVAVFGLRKMKKPTLNLNFPS